MAQRCCWVGLSIDVCHTSYFTSYFMLQTFYFVISHRARRWHSGMLLVGAVDACLPHFLLHFLLHASNFLLRYLAQGSRRTRRRCCWLGQSINVCLCDMPIHLTRRHGGHGDHTPNVIPCRCTPPAWNLPGLAIGRLCGWNQYNVRWS